MGINRADICYRVLERMKGLPEDIPINELRREIGYLRAYPLLMEAHIRSKNGNLNSEDLRKLEELQRKVREVPGYLRDMLSPDLDDNYVVSIFKPETGKALCTRVQAVNTCWSEGIHGYEGKSRVLVSDIETGGSVVIFGEREYSAWNDPRVFSRANVCIEANRINGNGQYHTGEPLLFIDTAEMGRVNVNRLWQWGNRGHELVRVIAGHMYVARQLGFNTVALGEIEVYELGRRLGARTRKLFETGSKPHQRKIGRPVSTWQLGDNKDGRYYILQLDLQERIAEALKRNEHKECRDAFERAQSAMAV